MVQSPSALKKSIEGLQATAQKMKNLALTSMATVELRKSNTIKPSQRQSDYQVKYEVLQRSYEAK